MDAPKTAELASTCSGRSSRKVRNKSKKGSHFDSRPGTPGLFSREVFLTHNGEYESGSVYDTRAIDPIFSILLTSRQEQS